MIKIIASTIFSVLLLSSVPSAMAQSVNDSTGYSGGNIQYGDAVYSSTWNRVAEKPETATRWPEWDEVTEKPKHATRWPNWNEVSGKPSSFPPSSHNHDSRYIRRIGDGSISGDLTVGGRLRADSLRTNDVGGDRWCRATSSGIIRCTYNEPSSTQPTKGSIVGGGYYDEGGPGGSLQCNSWGSASCGGGSPHYIQCPSGSSRRTSGVKPYESCGHDSHCQASSVIYSVCVKS